MWTSLALLLFVGLAYAAEDHKGTRFIVAFMAQFRNSETGHNEVVITASRRTTVRVQSPQGSFDEIYVIEAGEVERIRFPGAVRMFYNRAERKGILITSNYEVSVYCNNAGIAGESFLALPVSDFNATLTQEFLIPSYNALSVTYSLIGIAAQEENTNVQIVPPLPDGGHDFANALNLMMMEFETYQLAIRGGDTTGYLVTSDKPVAVYGGASCVFVPTGVQYCDHIVEQIPPIYTWGEYFATAPIQPRRAGDVYRVLASENDTSITAFNYGTRRGLNRGQFFEFERRSNDFNYFICSKPCLIVQYNKGISADNLRGGTDPFMMIVPPVKQFTGPVIFTTFRNRVERDYANYLAVIASLQVAGGLTINEQIIPRRLWSPIPGTNYTTLLISGLLYRTYRIDHWAPNVEFMAFSYGHQGIESYGHPVGCGLKSNKIVDLPTPPPTTPEPTTPPGGPFNEKCNCTIRLEANITAGESEPTDVLYQLDSVWYNNTKGRCYGCEEVMDQCRIQCDGALRKIYGTQGLNSSILINNTSEILYRPLGQVMCDEWSRTLSPPGLRLVAYYEPGTCGGTFHTFVAPQALCCQELDVPEIGSVVVWDAQCDADVELPTNYQVK
ncbi:unnamed protein product [Owenia fusiformis]|uniref:IgGFc-binding protein N-terminal domain-containing protein n=1 Tax=Owenia fusiformis TaxID=6347 RepID=A0A8S4N382_OWEFU|nr:unnamed protein product [Owenia fusiformis]